MTVIPAQAGIQVALSVIDKQRLAGVMTQEWPATQVGVGGGASAWRLRATPALPAATIGALLTLSTPLRTH